MIQFNAIALKILKHGEEQPTRGTPSLVGTPVSYKVSAKYNFPLMTTRRLSFKNILVETLWFLSGEKTLRILDKHNVKFWNKWRQPDGTVPSSYGWLWRHYQVDQIHNLIEGLKTDPFSRRHVVTAWFPERITTHPPCHVMFTVNLFKNHLNLSLFQRSCDIPIGLPYNIAGYALIIKILAHILNYKPGQFHHFIANPHIYVDQVPLVKEHILRNHVAFPYLVIDDSLRTLEDFVALADEPYEVIEQKIRLFDYRPLPEIHYPINV